MCFCSSKTAGHIIFAGDHILLIRRPFSWNFEREKTVSYRAGIYLSQMPKNEEKERETCVPSQKNLWRSSVSIWAQHGETSRSRRRMFLHGAQQQYWWPSQILLSFNMFVWPNDDSLNIFNDLKKKKWIFIYFIWKYSIYICN